MKCIVSIKQKKKRCEPEFTPLQMIRGKMMSILNGNKTSIAQALFTI